MGKITIKTYGLRAFAGKVGRAAAMADRDAQDILETWGRAAMDIFKVYAPEDGGELKRVMRMEPWEYPGIQIIDDPESEEGFHYMEITRFGHAPGPQDRIYPRFAKALNIPGIGFRAWVSRFHPPSDWVEDAQPGIEVRFLVAERNMAARVESRLG